MQFSTFSLFGFRLPVHQLCGAGLALCLAQEVIASDLPQQSSAAKQQFYSLPMHFEPNVGQIDRSVDYVSRGPGYTVFLTPSQAVLSLKTQNDPVEPQQSGRKKQAQLSQTSFAMKLVGANAHATAQGQEQLQGTVNYFLGNEPAQWRSSIPLFAKVKYAEVYPAIDLLYYSGNQQQLEYDFIVAPGSDPHRIRIAFSGVDQLSIDEEGGLSGAPLCQRATAVIRTLHRLAGTRLPIIGVGGIFTAADAYAKIRAGASLVQLYTGMIFQGPRLAREIARGLVDLLHRDGLTHLREAIGRDA